MSAEPKAAASRFGNVAIIHAPAHSSPHGPFYVAMARLAQKKAAMMGLWVILTFYIAGICAPWVAPFDFATQDLSAVREGPSLKHWLGTDLNGRDHLSRIVWGARTSTIVSAASVLTGSIFVGITLGALAGYLRGWVDQVIMRVGEIFLAFPSLLLIIMISATIRPRVREGIEALEKALGMSGLVESGFGDYMLVFGVIGLFGWVGMARLVRGQILRLREMEFVMAATATGASQWRVITSHLLPNVMSQLLVVISMSLGGAIGSELVLSWLGVGIQPPMPSLGAMIYQFGGQSALLTYPHLLLGPVLLVAAVFFAFNFLGDGLNDALNPRTR
ncbi:MAG: ABC transporter permease [Chloroflexi bacterium]|nr:ABC transporter permease [Chloroflexota bacterium]